MSFYQTRQRITESVDSGFKTFATMLAEYWDIQQVERVKPGSDKYDALSLQEKIELHTDIGDSHNRKSRVGLVFGSLLAFTAANSGMNHNELLFTISSGVTVLKLGMVAMELHGARTEYNTADAYRTAEQVANISGLATAAALEQA